MRFRIRKAPGYDFLYQLERYSTWFGWIKLINGTEKLCREALNRVRIHGTSGISSDKGVVHEEEINI